MTISDAEFLEQFEAKTLNPGYFNHQGHLRLAWLFLNKYDLEVAIEKVTTGISAYATNLGATGKFKHTLTEAIVRIIARRMETQRFGELESFLASNNDLVTNIWGVVNQHYTEERLNSDLAISQFVEPDRLPI